MATLFDLKPHEEVLGLVLAGRTNRPLAKQISIIEKLSSFSFNKIYTQTGCECAW
jgi:hypothetical protein